MLGGTTLGPDGADIRAYAAFTTDGGDTWRSAGMPEGLAGIRDVGATP